MESCPSAHSAKAIDSATRCIPDPFLSDQWQIFIYQPAEVVRELFVDIFTPSEVALESAVELIVELDTDLESATLTFTESDRALLSAVLTLAATADPVERAVEVETES